MPLYSDWRPVVPVRPRGGAVGKERVERLLFDQPASSLCRLWHSACLSRGKHELALSRVLFPGKRGEALRSLAALSSREYEPLGMPHIARRAQDAAKRVIRRLFCFSRCSIRKIRRWASLDFLQGWQGAPTIQLPLSAQHHLSRSSALLVFLANLRTQLD
jgi:hypothetical protein